LAAYEAEREELAALGVSIYAASVDTLEQAPEVMGHGLTFPLGYGVTREESERFGAWWGDARGGFIQPSEFLLGPDGMVLESMYASGPVGRMSVDETLRFITNRERRRLEQEQAASGASSLRCGTKSQEMSGVLG
jgi:peroxiredoxin